MSESQGGGKKSDPSMSVPSGATGKDQQEPMLVRMGRGDIHVNMPSGHGDSQQAVGDVVDIVVYFANNVGLHLRVCDGQNATATELFEMVMNEQDYPVEARELFSLWLVSDLLELQLKPTHIPFKLVCYWEELLEKYSSASEFNRQRDEPVIMFRRNVFCTLTTENQILNSKEIDATKMNAMVEMLYYEARTNILSGRYPVDQDKCDQLAGLHACTMPLKLLDEAAQTELRRQLETEEYYKASLSEYLPSHFSKRNWVFNKNSNPEFRLLASYRNKSAELRQNTNVNVTVIYRQYLDICQALPYYGCAFFRGQVEHPARRLLSSRVDDPVYVAINTEGVYVIDEDDFVLLIGLPFEFLCWERAETAQQSASECLPCLFLQFPVNKIRGKETSKSTQLFQIFSRETILMDKLIEACVELKRSTPPSQQGADLHIIKGYGEIAEQFERLTFITFDETRKRIGKPSVRVPRSASVRQPPRTATSHEVA